MKGTSLIYLNKWVEQIIINIITVCLYSLYIFSKGYVGSKNLSYSIVYVIVELIIVLLIFNQVPFVNRKYFNFQYNNISFKRLQNKGLIILGITLNTVLLLLAINIVLGPLMLLSKHISYERVMVIEFLISLCLLLYTSITHGIYYNRLYIKKSIELEESESKKLENQIKSIRSQFNPNLVHHALNYIENHQGENNEEAIQCLEMFSRALRYKVYEVNRETVLLDQEFDQLINYAKLLQQVYACSIDVEITSFPQELFIKPLVLHSLLDTFHAHSTNHSSISITGIAKKCDYEITFTLYNSTKIYDLLEHSNYINILTIIEEYSKQPIEAQYNYNSVTLAFTLKQ